MSQEAPQNYANHRTFDRQLYLYGAFVLGALFLSGIAVSGLFDDLNVQLLAVGQLLLGVGVTGGWLRMRAYAVRLQDRIIRLEMRLRLERTLPDNLKGRIHELTVPQLIGLRFAGDDELPELTRQALEENLAKSDDIKQRVKNWQADHLRV